MICAHMRPTWRTSTTARERRTIVSHLQFDETSLEVSKQIDDDRWFDQQLFTENAEKVDYYPVSWRDSENHALQNGNLGRHEVLKIEVVFIAMHASNIEDQARHVVLVEAFCEALPQKSRSKQSNDSTVDSTCTSLEFTNKHWRKFKRVVVMETLQTHINSRKQEIIWAPQQN